MLGPTIETERLTLRPPLPEDFEAWASMLADPEVMCHLGGVQPRPMAWRAMACMAGEWALYGFGMFSVIERSSRRWLGRLGPWWPDGWPGSEVGWALVREVHGRGYASEGAAAAIDWAFDHLGWREVIHTIAPDNAASIALAQRLGSERLRPGRLPPPHDVAEIDIYGQSRDAWRARWR